jgi:hypothetical protein
VTQVVDAELQSLRRTLPRVLLGVAIAFVLIGGIIAAFGAGADRPEGAAEQFLNDISDTTRKGVEHDALERVAKLGDPSLIAQLIPPGFDADKKAAFTDIEVGAATRKADGDVVPFRVRLRNADRDERAALLLVDTGDSWHVQSIVDAQLAGKVPSEGGSKVASAPAPVYLGALVIGFFVTVAISALNRRLERSTS